MVDIIAGGIIEHQGKVLLIQEKNPHGKWNLPIGRMEEGENIFQTAVREVKEETGLECEIENLVRIFEYEKEGRHKLKFIFRMNRKSGEVKKGHDLLDAKWLEIDEIRKLKKEDFRNDDVPLALEEYWKGSKYGKELLKVRL